MSWSRSASGTSAAIKEQVSHWPEQQKRDDEANTSLSGEAKQGHATQIDCAVKAVEALVAVFPDKLMAVSAGGHADQTGAGNVSVSYTLIK